jgi:hypothetical protein
MTARQKIRGTGSTNLSDAVDPERCMIAEVVEQCSSEADGFYNVIVRVGVDPQEGPGDLGSLEEIAIALSLAQAEDLRKRLANFVDGELNELPAIFDFEGDNARPEIGAPSAYVKRQGRPSEPLSVTLMLEQGRRQDTGLKLELRAPQGNGKHWYASILFSREQALLFAYMVYYSVRECRDWRDQTG